MLGIEALHPQRWRLQESADTLLLRLPQRPDPQDTNKIVALVTTSSLPGQSPAGR